MFKRTEKKIKAVFKMQFEATQVPQLKAKKLMISLLPVDVGKPTVRLPKAPILEGICTWESPIYETVKLIKEIKSGRIREKFYYVVVATGSSKSGFLGEVSIDFADLAEATKPRKLTLPLQTTKSGAILHVTVQRIHGDSDSRHAEENEDLSEDLSEVASPHNERNSSVDDGEESDSNGTDSRDGSVSGRMANQMRMLERKVELSELEAESLRKQVVKETQRGQELLEQITSLKVERDSIKVEYERIKQLARGQHEEEDPSHGQRETNNQRRPTEDTERVLQREKQLNKKLRMQIQKTEDSNSEYVLAIRDLNKKLEQKNTEISRLSSKIKALYSEGKTAEDVASKCGNADEEEKLKQKIEDLYSEIEVHKKEKADIQVDLERLNLDYESLEAENQDIYAKLEQIQTEQMEIQQNSTESLATLKQFKLRVASLEEEAKRQAFQYSESLNMIDELEAEVESLKNELEHQVRVFEEDLELVSEAKFKMEQRAIRAEEELRKAKRSNANTADRLEEQCKELSAELSLQIDENEKLTQEAAAEAHDLRQKNSTLEEMLQKARDELEITKEKYEQLLEMFTEQKKETSEGNKGMQKDKEDMERKIASARQEAEKLMQENISIKSQIDQRKTKEDNLQLEVKKLRLKNNEVKNQLHELELEKGDMKKEISKLQSDLRKKKQGSERSAAQDTTTEQKNGHPGGTFDVPSLLSEVASLKERNKNMENELKEMHEKYSEVSLRFAEVEGERQQLALAVRNLKSGKKN